LENVRFGFAKRLWAKENLIREAIHNKEQIFL